MNNKIIFHLDLDCFFCRCEEIVNPYLEGVPFVISNNKDNGIISTSNKLARKYNVKSAMPIFKAKKLCNDLVIVEPHYDLYEDFSKKFFDIIRTEFTPEIEILSIDECFLDATKLIEQYHNSIDILAKKIIDVVYNSTKLYLTIGVGNNKFLAKVAGDTKPKSRVAKLFIDDIKDKIWPLDIQDVYGVGKKVAYELKELNINKVKDFIEFNNQELLKNKLKKRYYYLLDCFTGSSSYEVENNSNKFKSLGLSRTFDFKTNDQAYIKKYLKFLINELIEIINEENITLKTITLTLKYENQQTKTKSKTFNQYIENKNDLLSEFVKLFNNFWNKESIYLIGVSVSNIIKIGDNFVFQTKIF